jgi:hypothetical protein
VALRSRSCAIFGFGAADSRYGIPIQKVGVSMPYPELAILIQMLGRPTMLALLLEGQLQDAAWAERRGLLRGSLQIWKAIWRLRPRASSQALPSRIATTSISRSALSICSSRSIRRMSETLMRRWKRRIIAKGSALFSNVAYPNSLAIESRGFETSGLDEVASKG